MGGIPHWYSSSTRGGLRKSVTGTRLGGLTAPDDWVRPHQYDARYKRTAHATVLPSLPLPPLRGLLLYVMLRLLYINTAMAPIHDRCLAWPSAGGLGTSCIAESCQPVCAASGTHTHVPVSNFRTVYGTAHRTSNVRHSIVANLLDCSSFLLVLALAAAACAVTAMAPSRQPKSSRRVSNGVRRPLRVETTEADAMLERSFDVTVDSLLGRGVCEGKGKEKGVKGRCVALADACVQNETFRRKHVQGSRALSPTSPSRHTQGFCDTYMQDVDYAQQALAAHFAVGSTASALTLGSSSTCQRSPLWD